MKISNLLELLPLLLLLLEEAEEEGHCCLSLKSNLRRELRRVLVSLQFVYKSLATSFID